MLLNTYIVFIARVPIDTLYTFTEIRCLKIKWNVVYTQSKVNFTINRYRHNTFIVHFKKAMNFMRKARL